MHSGESMSRAEIFAALRYLGVTEARVSYHGGNDESFVEEIALEDPEGYPVEAGLTPRLETALEESVYDELGEDFGDAVDGVDGELVFDADQEKVYLKHSYMEWVAEEPREL